MFVIVSEPSMRYIWLFISPTTFTETRNIFPIGKCGGDDTCAVQTQAYMPIGYGQH